MDWMHRTSRRRPEGQIRRRTNCTEGSMLFVDPVDLPRASLVHCRRKAGSGWVPMKGGDRLPAFGYNAGFDSGSRTGGRTSRKRLLAFVPQLRVHCGGLADEGEPWALLLSSQGGA